MTYNLLDAPWVPVLRRDGTRDTVGISGALSGAGDIREVAASNPMDRLAIIRFLLAVVYWSAGPTTDDDPRRDPLGPATLHQLAQNARCFDLLGPAPRFYQDPTARRQRPVTDLVHEVPSGNNFAHFAHVLDYGAALCPACCVVALLRLPLFSSSGTGGVRAGINGTPPVYVVRLGDTLGDTLRANWLPTGPLGVPSWVTPLFAPRGAGPVPMLEGLTMLSRRVWLDEDSAGPGTCTACGVPGALTITRCKCEGAPEQRFADWVDPHVLYGSEPEDKPLVAPNPLRAGRFATDRPWCELLARLVDRETDGTGAHSARFLAVGYALNQALGVDVWERTVALPEPVPPAQLVATLLRQWDSAVWAMGKRVQRGRAAPKAVLAPVRAHIESEMADVAAARPPGEPEFATAVEMCAGHPLRALAGALSPGITVASLRRRLAIAAARPQLSAAQAEQAETEDERGEE